MKQPRVSILIPAYNREKYIGECIQSAIDQTFTDIEIVVVDNASTDCTWDICQAYAAKDSRVQIFRNASNIGPVRNWLECVKHMRGEFAKILWSDDLIHPTFLEKLLPYMEMPDVGFAYSAVKVFSERDPEKGAITCATMPSVIYDSEVFIRGALIGSGFPASPGCAIFRSADVKKNLLLDVPNRIGSDFSMHAIGNDLLLFLLTAVSYSKFAFIDESLAYFRGHAESITSASLLSDKEYGKVPLCYDLAKGYFLSDHLRDRSLRKALNVRLLRHLWKYRRSNIGIRRLADFYPDGKTGGIDFRYLVKNIMMKVHD